MALHYGKYIGYKVGYESCFFSLIQTIDCKHLLADNINKDYLTWDVPAAPK